MKIGLPEMAEDVLREADAAQAKYGDFASTHEAYGVLAEEVAELLEAIRANALGSVEMEATQVAAVALRLAAQARESVGSDDAFARRSGAGK